MRYGIVTANLEEYADPRVAVRLARAAEAAGWEAFFVWDHLGFVRGVPSGFHGSSCLRLRTPRSALSSAGLLKEGGLLASSVYAAEVESLAQRGIKAMNVGAQPDARRLGELSRMVDAGELTVSLKCTFPLERAPEALGESRTGHARGKVVLLVD